MWNKTLKLARPSSLYCNNVPTTNIIIRNTFIFVEKCVIVEERMFPSTITTEYFFSI